MSFDNKKTEEKLQPSKAREYIIELFKRDSEGLSKRRKKFIDSVYSLLQLGVLEAFLVEDKNSATVAFRLYKSKDESYAGVR